MKSLDQNRTLSASAMASPFFLLTVGLTVVYTVLFSYLSILRFQSFNCGIFDMGIMIQTFWNTAHGRLLEESVNLGFPFSRLWVAHTEVIYIPLALIYKFFPWTNTILILQTIFVAAGAIPVYLLARQHLKHELLAFVFALAYLLYPGMQNANLTDVHGLTFASSLLLFTFYFLQNRQYVAFWIFAVLSLCCREDYAILVFMMGFYAIFILKERRVGVSLCLVSLFWFFMIYKGRYFIMEWAGITLPAAEDTSRSHWSQLEGGKVIFQRPLYFLDEILLTKINLRYLVNVLGPLAFLSLLAPFEIAMAAPMFAIYLLSDWVAAKVVDSYYIPTVSPFVFISAIYGLRNLRVYLKPRLASRKTIWSAPQFAAVVIIALSFVFFSFQSKVRQAGNWKRTPRHEKIDRAIAQIPAAASLSADLTLGTHAAERREFFVFPDRLDDVEYVLYDFYAPEYRFMTRDTFFLPVERPLNPPIQRVLSSGEFGCVWFDDGITVFARGADFVKGREMLAFADEKEISEPAEVMVDGLQFRGYTRQVNIRVFEKRILHVTVFWQRHYAISGNRFVYQISHGTFSQTFVHEPVFGLFPANEWPENQLVRDEVYWDIPSNLSRGEFAIRVRLEKSMAVRGTDGAAEFVKLFVLKIE